MEHNVTEWKFKKVKIPIVVLLTFLTLGMYLGYWFLRERKNLIKIDTKRQIPIKLWWCFTIFLGLSFLFNMIGQIILTPYGNAVFTSFDIIGTFYFLGFFYYSLFRVKEIIEEIDDETTFKPWLLVIFHVWYLQFKFNRLGDNRFENQNFKKAIAE